MTIVKMVIAALSNDDKRTLHDNILYGRVASNGAAKLTDYDFYDSLLDLLVTCVNR